MLQNQREEEEARSNQTFILSLKVIFGVSVICFLNQESWSHWSTPRFFWKLLWCRLKGSDRDHTQFAAGWLRWERGGHRAREVSGSSPLPDFSFFSFFHTSTHLLNPSNTQRSPGILCWPRASMNFSCILRILIYKKLLKRGENWIAVLKSAK